MATAQPAGKPFGSDTGRLQPGTEVGRFEIVRLLGTGSMGAVYLARDPLIDREVAVKTLAGNFSIGAAEMQLLRRRLLNEARSAGALEHPGIVTVYDVIEAEDGRVSIAMEYASGRSLRTILDDAEPLPLEFIQRTISAIAAALDHAHSKGLIHRDIKPANILFTADGELKIADFGIASLRGDDLASDLNSLGTPNYLAPERILGQEAGHLADVYALGVILYEMLTRRLPYQGETMGELVHNVVQRDHTDPRSLRPDLPSSMVSILAEALAKDPASRYQSAGDLARDVRSAVEAQAALSGTVPTTVVEELELVELQDESGATESALEPPADGEDEAPTVPGISLHGTSPNVSVEARAGLPWGKRRLLLRLTRPARATRVVLMAVGGALLIAVLMMAIGALGKNQKMSTEDAGEALRRLEYQSLLAESRRLFAVGDYRLAEAALMEAEALSPEAANIAQLRAEAERQRLQRLDRERRAEAKAHFLDAQSAFEAQDLSATEEALQLLFEVDSEHEGGRALVAAVAAVRAALERPAPRVVLAEQLVESIDEPIVEEQAPVEETSELPSEEPWIDPFGTLRIDLQSERPKGVVTLYHDGEQIFRRAFRFVERRGLIRRRGVQGGFTARQSIPAGDLDLRVYLTLPSRPAQSRVVSASFMPGSLRTLFIRVDDTGRLAVDLD